jgi:hypothetical protein
MFIVFYAKHRRLVKMLAARTESRGNNVFVSFLKPFITNHSWMNNKHINSGNTNKYPKLKINMTFNNPQTQNCNCGSDYRPENYFAQVGKAFSIIV